MQDVGQQPDGEGCACPAQGAGASVTVDVAYHHKHREQQRSLVKSEDQVAPVGSEAGARLPHAAEIVQRGGCEQCPEAQVATQQPVDGLPIGRE